MIEVYDPGNSELVGTVPSASHEDVERVLATASKASEVARKIPTHLRIDVLRQVAEQLLQRHEEFAVVIAKEGIKRIVDYKFEDLDEVELGDWERKGGSPRGSRAQDAKCNMKAFIPYCTGEAGITEERFT